MSNDNERIVSRTTTMARPHPRRKYWNVGDCGDPDWRRSPRLNIVQGSASDHRLTRIMTDISPVDPSFFCGPEKVEKSSRFHKKNLFSGSLDEEDKAIQSSV